MMKALLYRYEIEDADGEWQLAYPADSLDDWEEFRDACGGRDHVRVVNTATGIVVFEFIPMGAAA